MAAFPRTIVPRTDSLPHQPPPLIVASQSMKRERRQTAAKGFMWRETWGPLDMSSTAAGAFLREVDYLWSSGTNFTITPWPYSSLANAPGSLGTLATGATGSVNGSSQTGTTLVTNGWAANGTIPKRNYITVAGVPYSFGLRSAATASTGGAITFSIYPAIGSGDAPNNSATVTVNGPMTAVILEEPNFPTAVESVDWYGGFSVLFGEDV